MIIVGLWLESGCSWEDGEFQLSLESVAHDSFCLHNDPDLVVEAVKEHFCDSPPKPDTNYEIYLDRTAINVGADVPDCRMEVTSVRIVPSSGVYLDR